MNKSILALGIECSCDDTAIGLVKLTYEESEKIILNVSGKILSSYVFNQNDLHNEYGGVVPEIAARAHSNNLQICLEKVLQKSKISLEEINVVCVTSGPGLIGGLISGINFAKGISFGLNKSLVGVNHLAGHALTPRLTNDLKFPYLMLLASGGHCQYLAVINHKKIKRLGTTIDDAPGEAFDKGARVIGLGYPGGPAIEKCALNGNPNSIDFPRPLAKSNKIEFSFSGLKTSLLYFMDSFKESKNCSINDVAASYQNAIIDCLISKLQLASKETGINTITIAGGVAKNSVLRNQLKEVFPKNNIIFPDLNYCTDNAAMISYLGEKKFNLGSESNMDFGIFPNFQL